MSSRLSLSQMVSALWAILENMAQNSGQITVETEFFCIFLGSVSRCCKGSFVFFN